MGTMIDSGWSASATAYTAQTKAAGSQETSAYGKTIGAPKLSETGAKYYEQLKEKYSDYEFVLVSSEEKEQAMANAAKYAQTGKTVVLIDEEHVENMAVDSTYRQKYEDVLTGAKSQLAQLADGLKNTAGVKGFGIQVNDNGTASFFAAVDRQAAAAAKKQQERIEKRKEQKTEQKKDAKRAADEKRMRSSESDKASEKAEASDAAGEVEIVSAASIEELMRKIQDLNYTWMSDRVMTDAERAVGGTIDWKG